jgi:3',5'-cyclic AMP phosphodiesterase CpdA
LLAIASAIGACSEVPSTPAGTVERPVAVRVASLEPLLVGAGDIAQCYQPDNPTSVTPPQLTAAESTAALLDSIPGTVMAVGDNAYEFGSSADYALCYEPTWGRHKARTRPAAGNHEYLTPGAAGYFAYFGLTAAPPAGYYSYDLGAWHVIVLNSTPQWAACQPPRTSPADGRACPGDVAQRAWLATDLAAHRQRCTLAYFHHPRYSSGLHGSQYEMQQFWDALYAAGVDVVISGHDHLYERFAPQDPEGHADRRRGIRQFTVGTGGAALYPFTTVLPNSEVRDNRVHGVLAMRLGERKYQWTFIGASGGTIVDSGTGSCH